MDQLTSLLQNSFTTTFGYNNRDWVSSIVMKKGSQTKLDLSYLYDDLGNVKTIGSESYTYDWLDRLKTASGGSLPTLSYTYDEEGNRLTKVENGVTTSYTVVNYNVLTSDGTWSYAYDRNGNLAHKTKSTERWHYEFNALDQLTRVIREYKQGGQWRSEVKGEYWYDASGARAKTLEGGVETHYVYFGHDPLYEKTVGTSSQTDYVYVNGRLKAKLVGSDTYYYFADALGSIRQVWKQGGNQPAFSVATYKPFGTPISPSGTEKVTYAGELLVSATGPSPGLYYIGARWMDPELGRWLSLDPELGSLRYPQSLNRYVYVVNNPLRFTDPTGKLLNIIAAALGAAVGAVASLVIYSVEVALTDKTWDWQALGVEVASGAIAGAVAGLLMNPQVGLAVKAGTKAAMLGEKALAKVAPSLAGKVFSSKAAPYVSKAIAGTMAGAVAGPVSYSSKYGLDVARGEDPRLSWQGFMRGIAESSLFGGIGGGVGAPLGSLLGKYLGRHFDTLFAKLGMSDTFTRFSLSGTVVGESLTSRFTSQGISRAFDSLFVVGPLMGAQTMPTYADA